MNQEEKLDKKLTSIPNEMHYTGMPSYKNLIDVDKMQGLLDEFRKMVGVPFAIIDLEGNVVLGTEWQRICTHFHRVHPETCKRCIESDTILGNRMAETQEQSYYQCKNGLTDAAAPIFLEGKHVANFFTGQFLLSEPDIDFFKRQCAEYGFDEEEYLKALREVPIVEETKAISIVSFLRRLAETIGESALKEKRILESKARLGEMNAELERSNAELEQFAYVASHDLRAPLRAIESLSKWLEQDLTGSLPPQSAEHLRLLRGRAQRMEALLDALLDYSRVGRIAAEASEVDPAAIVREIADSFSLAGRFSLTIGELPRFTTARTPLWQVLHNLISNAVKHHDQDRGSIAVTATRRDGFIEFSVKDDGPGIPEQFREQVFGMFQTLRPRDEVEGSGMGLALVKKIVENYTGSVTIHAVQPRGTEVRFTWPLEIGQERDVRGKQVR